MKKNFSWLFIANIFKGFYQWIVLILIVKYYSNYEVAEFTLAYALSAPIFMLTNLQLKSIYIVDYKHEEKQFNYFLLRFLTVITSIIGFLIYFELTQTFSYIFFIIIIIKSIESIFDIIHGYFQKIEAMQYMSKSIIFQSIFSLLTFFISINIQEELYIALIFVAISNILVLIFYDLRIILQIEKKAIFKINIFNIDYVFIKYILLNAIPLGIAVFITSYTTNLPRIEVESYLGMESLAYFGAFSYMSIGLFQMLLPLQIIIRSKLAKVLHNKKNHLFFKYLIVSIAITSIFSIVLYSIFSLFGEKIITFVYNKSYSEYIEVLLYLFIGQGILFITGLLNIAVQAYQIFKLQVFISSIVLVFSYSISSYMINTFSLLGASYLVVFYAFLSLLLYFIVLVRKINEN